jgi:hypothetical protein
MQPFVQARPAKSPQGTRDKTSFFLDYADFVTKPDAECPHSSMKIARVAVSYIVSSIRTINALIVLLEKFGEIAGGRDGGRTSWESIPAAGGAWNAYTGEYRPGKQAWRRLLDTRQTINRPIAQGLFSWQGKLPRGPGRFPQNKHGNQLQRRRKIGFHLSGLKCSMRRKQRPVSRYHHQDTSV